MNKMYRPCLKKKIFNDPCLRIVRQPLFKGGRHRDGCRSHCNGAFPGGREMRFSSDFNKDKWEFISKEQGGGQ